MANDNDAEFAALGLALDPVRGARSFRVDKLGRLTGIHYPQVWTPGENLAVCRKDVEPKRSGTYASYMDQMNKILNSQLYSYSWSTTTTTTAPAPKEKPVNPKKPHPMTKCAHGFYGYYDGSDDYHDERAHVSAVIEGYGETLIGSRGFRCMKAKIVALHSTNERALTAIRRNYAEIPFFDRFIDMVSEFPPDGGTKAVGPSDSDFWTRDA